MAGAAETLTFEQLGARFQRLASEQSGMSFEEPLKIALVAIKAATRENFAGGHGPNGEAWKPLAFPRPAGGSRPLRSTDLLMASCTAAGAGHIENVTQRELVIGSNLDRAAIHQYGGTIRPTRAKWLAIPLTKEAARAGSPLHFTAELVPIFGSRGGVMVEKDRPDHAQFALVKQVVIPARPYLGFGTKLIERIGQIFEDWYQRRIEQRL